MTQIFLHNGVTSFPNPGNWNPTNNKVECVGQGGLGGTYIVGNFTTQGAGGGGGGYAFDVNLNPTFPVAINVPPYETATGSAQISSTWWAGFIGAAGTILANFGQNPPNPGNASTQPGGGGAVGNTPNGASGGRGSDSNSASTLSGGGGGAAGPHGAGGGYTSGNPSTTGAAGDNGNTPAQTANGGAGNSGTQWDNIYGIGGGGAGSTTGSGGTGGNFGGGGGGGFGPSGGAGLGKPGLMVITYVPTPRVNTQIFLYTGVTSFPEPGNWDSGNNKVEVVGTGGAGTPSNPFWQQPGPPFRADDDTGVRATGPYAGVGGGGGAYNSLTNLAPIWPARVSIPAGTGLQGINAWFGGNFTPAPSTVTAACASSGTSQGPGANGQGGYPYPTSSNGGSATGAPNSATPGAGGGAGGPHGIGGSASGAIGGSADGGRVPSQATNGAAGNSSTLWDNIHGIGGGGAGSTTGYGGAGGYFGGGGGGGAPNTPDSTNNQGPGLVVITYRPRTTTQLFLYANVTSFPNPGNWNPANNKVECVGSGGNGSIGYNPMPPNGGPYTSVGGGGGAYSWVGNLSPTFPVQVGITGPQVGVNSYTTFGGNAGGPNANALTQAQSGNSGQGQSGGGQGGTDFRPNGFAGGGSSGLGATGNGNGGGGAAGPNGAGGAGSLGSSSGFGGAGNGGFTNPPSAGNPGTAGTYWDQIHGSGAGGGGGVTGGAAAGVGGNFGGGAGSQAGNVTSGPAPVGANGLIVINYVPLAPPLPQGQAQIMA